MLFLTISLTLVTIAAGSQEPDGYDTLYTRSAKVMVIPKYDTLAQLEKASKELDTIMCKLNAVKYALGIKDTLKIK